MTLGSHATLPRIMNVLFRLSLFLLCFFSLQSSSEARWLIKNSTSFKGGFSVDGDQTLSFVEPGQVLTLDSATPVRLDVLVFVEPAKNFQDLILDVKDPLLRSRSTGVVFTDYYAHWKVKPIFKIHAGDGAREALRVRFGDSWRKELADVMNVQNEQNMRIMLFGDELLTLMSQGLQNFVGVGDIFV